jgi:hypothetical protein
MVSATAFLKVPTIFCCCGVAKEGSVELNRGNNNNKNKNIASHCKNNCNLYDSE